MRCRGCLLGECLQVLGHRGIFLLATGSGPVSSVGHRASSVGVVELVALIANLKKNQEIKIISVK